MECQLHRGINLY